MPAGSIPSQPYTPIGATTPCHAAAAGADPAHPLGSWGTLLTVLGVQASPAHVLLSDCCCGVSSSSSSSRYSSFMLFTCGRRDTTAEVMRGPTADGQGWGTPKKP